MCDLHMDQTPAGIEHNVWTDSTYRQRLYHVVTSVTTGGRYKTFYRSPVCRLAPLLTPSPLTPRSPGPWPLSDTDDIIVVTM